ncbi:hypothetical protein HZS_2411, partial [Henneguya salminicola]
MQPNDYHSWSEQFGKANTSQPIKIEEKSENLISQTKSLHGDNFGAAMLAKYGWKHGQGLGKKQQGISTALDVKKIGKNAAIIIDKDSKSRQTIPKNSKSFSPVVLLRVKYFINVKNMVDSCDSDPELEQEVKEECANKYGPVMQILIREIKTGQGSEPGVFVIFENMTYAKKAVSELDGRYFGGK